MPGTSPALEALIKALELFNEVKPVLDTALDNEAQRVGLTREERHALTKRLTGETNQITAEDESDNS